MAKKKGKQSRKAKQAVGSVQEIDETVKAPHSFVIYRGKLGKNAGELMRNFRKVLQPYTAAHMKVQKRNVVKDFVAVSGLLHVTHLVVFTKTQQAIYMRLGRLPRGPTLTFKVQEYSLSRDILSSLKRRVTYAAQFAHHPLLVLNNFSGEGIHFKLMASMFQNLFPSININKVNLNNIRRCVILNYDSETKSIDFRHYTIKVIPCGVSKSVKKIVQSKIPDLSRYDDISEFILQPGYLSESEAEQDGPFNEVTLPQKISSRGNQVSQKSALRLIELGPRLKLQLVKIEEGMMEGEVLYHSLIQKTTEEVKEIKRKREMQMKLKTQRRQKQEENKKRKEKFKSASVPEYSRNDQENESDVADMNDAEWYEKEIGEKPDADMFPSVKRKHKIEGKKSVKKARFEDDLQNVNKLKKEKAKKAYKGNKDETDGPKRRKDLTKKVKVDKPGPNSGTKIVSFEDSMKQRKKRKAAKMKKKLAFTKSKKVASHIREMKSKF